MPSPFPGMDPYLETPAYWRGLHNSLITFATSMINASLPPGFSANAEERVYINPPERAVYPDLLVMHTREPGLTPSQSGGTILADAASPFVFAAFPEEIQEPFIEIRTGEGWQQIVTIIEFLSPANKAPGSNGRQEYLQKQQEILNSRTHLVEIDLLRQGPHTIAAPQDGMRRFGTWDYVACIHRSSQRYQYAFWPIRMRDPLPIITLPLTEAVPELPLDLQTIFTSAYEAGPYARRVDYSRDPDVPLEGEDALWADALLREKGLRTG